MARLFSRWNRDLNAWVVDALSITDEDTVLDLGCGGGDGIALAAARARSVTGIDCSTGMVAAASSRNARAVRQGRVTVISQDVDDGIPLEADSVDKVFGVHVLSFLRRSARVVRDCHRVLRPGGRLMFAFDTHRRSPSLVRDVFEAAGHRLYDEGSAAGLLLRGGFDAVEVRNAPDGLHAVTGVCGAREQRDTSEVDPRWRLDRMSQQSRRS